MIYGDGNGFTEGCLLFMIGGGFTRIEKDPIPHNVENALIVNNGAKLISGQTYTISIEIIGNKVSLFIDGEKAATTLINNEIVRHGKIAFVKHWESSANVTYSNIKLKVTEKE